MRELSLSNCRLDKRYDVLDQLGRGSYAEIFVARDTLASPQSSHNLVVIKALNVFLQNDLDPDLERTLVENFQNEAVALDRVRHPNIISRLGHGTARDLAGTIFHYLVLEYLEGGDLQKAARGKDVSLKESLGYVEQICAGLRHAHRNSIIHRDIKPQNLLLTKDRETVKIADFGVARIFQSDSPITRVGTNIYAPPEHSPLAIGSDSVMTVSALTPAADIYSLAKSMYTLITAEAPRFYANQPITDLPMSVRDKEWAGELLRVLKKATISDPALRHQNVDEFWADLEPLRRIAIESETSTFVRPKLHAAPQPHVARGYSPLAPQQPKFDTSRDLRLRHPLIPNANSIKIDLESKPLPEIPAYKPVERVEDHWPNQGNGQPFAAPETNEDIAVPPVSGKKKHGFLRRAATFVFALALLGSGLYGASAYLRELGLLPQLTNVFREQTGRANTDINLRPAPSTNNEPIGVVTRNSKVRIVKTQNNWYQVDVLEQGREPSEPLAANRGWLNRRYVDLD